MSLFLSLFFSRLLLCSVSDWKNYLKVKNGLTTSLLFFLEDAKKISGRLNDAKQKKREREDALGLIKQVS